MKKERWHAEMKAIGHPNILASGKVYLDGLYEISPVNIVKNKQQEWFITLPNVCKLINGKQVYTPVFRFKSTAARNDFELAVKKALVYELKKDMELPELTVTIKEVKGKSIKAVATVNYDDILEIDNINVVEGKNGLFVSYPQTETQINRNEDIGVLQEIKNKLEKITQNPDRTPNNTTAELNEILKYVNTKLNTRNSKQKQYEHIIVPKSNIFRHHVEAAIECEYKKVVYNDRSSKEIVNEMINNIKLKEEKPQKSARR